MSSFLSYFKAISSSGPHQLHIVPDKQYYVPGELITGQIHLEVVGAPVSANGIDLTIKGFEKTEWNDVISRQVPVGQPEPGKPQQHRTEHEVKSHRGKATFFVNKQRIYNISNGLMQPGQYHFPFQYQLPNSLPGSFYERVPLTNVPHDAKWLDTGVNLNEYYDSDDEEVINHRGFNHDLFNSKAHRPKLFAAIMYKLKVTLDLNGLFVPDLHARMNLIIHPRLENSVQPATADHSQKVVVCCCINKGNCKIHASFDKNAYTLGETANVVADIENASTKPLEMYMVLHRTLKIKAGRHNGMYTGGNWTGEAAKEIGEAVEQQKYEGIPPNVTVQRVMPLPLKNAKILPSTKGDLVECSYTYSVDCRVSMGTDIHLRMPVTIYAPQPPPPQLPAFVIAAGGAPPVQPAPGVPIVVNPAQPQYPPQGQPQYPPQGQPQYPPQGQPQYPPQGQPQYPPQGQPQYPPQGQPQYPPQGQPQYPPQGQPQYPPQGQPQYPPQGQPQYPPQGQPQYAPQGQPQYPPQGQPQYPQGQPQYPPQGQPQYAPQGQPQYAPQGQPELAPQGQPQYGTFSN